MYFVDVSIDLFNLPPILRTRSVFRKGSNLERLLDLCIIVFSFNEEISWLNECCCSILNIIIWAFTNSSMFISVVISEGLGLVILFILIFAANSTTAIIFLILIQIEDIISSFGVTMISAFTMFSWSLFLNSGSSSFTGLIECLSQNHVFFWRPKESWFIKPSLYFTQVLRVKSMGCIISRIVMCWYILSLLNICVVSDKLHTLSYENFKSLRLIVNSA